MPSLFSKPLFPENNLKSLELSRVNAYLKYGSPSNGALPFKSWSKHHRHATWPRFVRATSARPRYEANLTWLRTITADFYQPSCVLPACCISSRAFLLTKMSFTMSFTANETDVAIGFFTRLPNELFSKLFTVFQHVFTVLFTVVHCFVHQVFTVFVLPVFVTQLFTPLVIRLFNPFSTPFREAVFVIYVPGGCLVKRRGGESEGKTSDHTRPGLE